MAHWQAGRDEEIILYYSSNNIFATLLIDAMNHSGRIEITASSQECKVTINTPNCVIICGTWIMLKPLDQTAAGTFTFLGGPNFGGA